jgi:hypothetical protein
MRPGVRARGRFAMLPETLILSGLDDACVRIFACIVMHAGARGDWPIPSATALADSMSQGVRKTIEHLEHLAGLALIALTKDGQSKYSIRLLHDLQEDLWNPNAVIPGPAPRARKESPYKKVAGSINDRPKSHYPSRDNRRPESRQRPSEIVGQPKYAETYEGMNGGAHAASNDEFCQHSGCSEFLAGHTFTDHEPLMVCGHIVQELCDCLTIKADTSKLDRTTARLLRAFPGASVLEGAT